MVAKANANACRWTGRAVFGGRCHPSPWGQRGNKLKPPASRGCGVELLQEAAPVYSRTTQIQRGSVQLLIPDTSGRPAYVTRQQHPHRALFLAPRVRKHTEERVKGSEDLVEDTEGRSPGTSCVPLDAGSELLGSKVGSHRKHEEVLFVFTECNSASLKTIC